MPSHGGIRNGLAQVSWPPWLEMARKLPDPERGPATPELALLHTASLVPRLLAAARGRALASGTSQPEDRAPINDSRPRRPFRGAGCSRPRRGHPTRPARRDAEPQREGALLGQESAAQRKYRLRRAVGQPQPRRAGLRCRPGQGATMRAPGARGGPGSPRSKSCSGAGS